MLQVIFAKDLLSDVTFFHRMKSLVKNESKKEEKEWVQNKIFVIWGQNHDNSEF